MLKDESKDDLFVDKEGRRHLEEFFECLFDTDVSIKVWKENEKGEKVIVSEKETDPDHPKKYRDFYTRLVTASFDTGYKEGCNEESLAIAKKMIKEGFTTTQITKLTGLSKEEITHIKNK